MAIIKTNTFEGGTTGGSVTTGNSGGASGDAWSVVSYPSGAVTFDSSSAAHGALGCKFAPASGQQAILRWTGFNDVTGVCRFYHTDDGDPAASESIMAIYTSTGATVLALNITNAGKYGLINAAGTGIGSTTNSRQAGDRIELSFTVGTTTSNGAWDFYLYRADATTATEHLSSVTENLGTTNWDRFQFGKNSTTTWTGISNFDDIAAASGTTALFGPATASANAAPVANAGPDQTDIDPFDTVTLDGSSSADSDGTVASYSWNQTGGTAVSLVGANTAQPTFVAPATLDGTVLTFNLVVTDNDGATSTADTVNITVSPHTMWRLDGGGPTPLQLIKL